MRGSALVLLLAAACLLATSFITWAQVIDSNPCQQACYEQKDVCVTKCGEHTNPVECEETCGNKLLDCLKQCR
jgi:hypothetical protein